MDDQEIQDGKIFATVGYWAILCILPLILKKDNRFAVYHGKQGLVLFIFLVAGFILSIIPVLGAFVYRLATFVYLVLIFWGTIGALAGRQVYIPVVSPLAEKITL